MVETLSDRNYACFCCSDYISTNKESDCESCGEKIDIGPDLVGTKVDGKTLSEYVARGFYGLTFRCENRLGISSAIKLIPKRLYATRGKNFEEEISKYVSLHDHPNIARLSDTGEAAISINGKQVEFHYIIMEWIEGQTLREFYQNERVSFIDVYSICSEVSSALSRFEANSLVHNDLNAENIMVVQLGNDEIGTKYGRSRTQIKIIDTGSAVYKGGEDKEKIADLHFVGQHTTALINAVYKDAPQPPLEEQDFLASLNNLAGQLRDESETRRITTAQAFYERVQEAYESRAGIHIEANESLKTPFAYLNALDFKDNSTLVGRLFNDEFPWIRESIMSAAQQVLITGPRGCGKTMILKNMRLRTQLLSSTQEPSPADFEAILSRLDFVGFFVSARVEIGNHLLTKKLAEWAEDDNNVICKFQLLYAQEALDTLSLIKSRFKVEYDLQAELRLCHWINQAIGRDAKTLPEALSDVRRTIQNIRQCQFVPKQAVTLMSGGFFKELCRLIARLHPSFEGKNINFLLDDFSRPKIPASTQKSLLPLIWAAGEGYFFKVSAHSKSVENVDNRDVRYDEQRDFTEVNLGKEYIDFTSRSAGTRSAHGAISNIIKRRFSFSEKFKGEDVEPAKILGTGETKIAERLVDSATKGGSYNYKGWKTILSLCSGEISFVLDIFGKLYESHDPQAPYPISTQVQNRTIKDLSKNELVQLQSVRHVHANLYTVAKAFGDMSRIKLLGPKVKDGKNSRFAEYTRMEIDLQDQNQNAIDAMNELIASGVFIDGGLSSSSRGTPTQRLIFRRLFTPAFLTTWNNRDGFNWTQRRFLQFISTPEDFVSNERLKEPSPGSVPLLDRLPSNDA